MSDLRDFIAGMPKCELHVHLEGTLEPEMKFELAKRNGMTLPYKDAAEMRAAYDFHDLPSFLKIYYEGMRVLVHEPDFYDLTFAYLAKAHSQNVRYVEMFFDPQPHTGRGVAFDVVIRGIRRAQLEAERILGIKSQLIMCFLRDWSAEFAMTTLVQSLPYREWIVGVGLDSDEKNNPPVKFKEVFARARQEGYLLTMHCDVDQQNSTEHIRQCLEEIGVNRIDHGVNVLDSNALIDEVAQAATGVDRMPGVQRLRHQRQQGQGDQAHARSRHPRHRAFRRSGLFPRLYEREFRLHPGRGRPRAEGGGAAVAQRLRKHLAAAAGQRPIPGRA